jgi:transposase InsO family protein
VKYAFIKEHSKEFSVKLMCKVLKVSRSCYYRWLGVEKQEDKELNDLIKNIFEISMQTYGTRRIKKQLVKDYGVIVSRRRIGKIMKKLGLASKTKKRFKVRTTDSNHHFGVAPNLLKQYFYTTEPDKTYVGDITYIPTKEGWLYLAVVIDLFSRKVVGWSMDERLKTSLVNDALLMAIKRRTPNKGLIWHTDRGSQYASDSHKQLLKNFGIIQSMSGKGNCYDNAVSESFFHTLKTELIHHTTFETKAQARMAIFSFIEIWYNRKRLHSYLGYMSPVEFEQKMLHSENNTENLKKVS